MTTRDEFIKEANKDATTSAYRVSVLYGDYGKRKTTTACSMVNERGLLLSSDGSWKVLLNKRHEELFSKIDVIKLEGLSQLEYINFDGYDTVIWDTFSRTVDGYTDLLYDEATWKNPNTGKPMFRETLTSKNKELEGVQILAAMDYRVTRDIFRPRLSKYIFNLPAHIIFTSQVNEPLKGMSADMTKRPAIPAATFKIVAEKADIIANIRPHTRSFIADVTENSIAFLGKSRIEGIEGAMPLDSFVAEYKEIVFK